MKARRFLLNSIISTVFIGIALGGAFSMTNANADGGASGTSNTSNTSNPNGPNTSNITDNQTPRTMSTTTSANSPGGSLTLDSVPSFSFGTANFNTNQPNTLHLDNGRNETLRVTDHREVDNKNDPNNKITDSSSSGWLLQANVGSFTGSDNTGPSNSKYNNNQNNNNEKWTIHLNPSSSNDEGNNPNMKSNYSLDSNTNNNNIMNTDTNTSGFGVSKLMFSNPTSASLDTPNVKQGSYSTSINWTLSTNVNSFNTDV